MRRRDFITLLGGAVAPWPRSARAQQKVPVIGFIGTTSPTAWREQIAAFEQRLGELGWASGRTITIEYRWTEGRNEQAPAIAQAFVERGVDIIVAGGNAVGSGEASHVDDSDRFPGGGRSARQRFVASLSRPGGNVTGLSLQGTDVAGKRLQMLHEIVPALRHLAIMANVAYACRRERARGNVKPPPARDRPRRHPDGAAGTPRIVADHACEIARRPAEALLMIASDALTDTNYARIGSLALSARMATRSSAHLVSIRSRSLMAYGPNLADMFRPPASTMSTKSARGKDCRYSGGAADQVHTGPRSCHRRALGLAVPPTLHQRLADEVMANS